MAAMHVATDGKKLVRFVIVVCGLQRPGFALDVRARRYDKSEVCEMVVAERIIVFDFPSDNYCVGPITNRSHIPRPYTTAKDKSGPRSNEAGCNRRDIYRIADNGRCSGTGSFSEK